MTRLSAILCPLLTQEKLASLNSIGIKTVVEFVCADVEDLAKRCSISYKVLQSTRRLLLAQYSSFPVNGADLHGDVMSSIAIFSTGCTSLDELLEGGLYTSEVLEVTGAPASGKTQLCISACSSVTAVTQKNVLYVDTTGAFTAQRLQDVMSSRGHSDKMMAAAFKRLHCSRVYDIFEVLGLLENTKAAIDASSDSFYSSLKLVVLDSVTSVVGPALGGQQTHGHGLMMHLAAALKSLAVEYSIAVLVTNNQVRGNGSDRKPSLGRTWSHVPHSRLLLSHNRSCNPSSFAAGRRVKRQAQLIKSRRQPTHLSCSFRIEDSGVCT